MNDSMKCQVTTITEPKQWLEQWRKYAAANGIGVSELIGIAVNEYIAKTTGKKVAGNRPTRGSGLKKKSPKKKPAKKKPAKKKPAA